jgi:hypothetical protein
MAITQKTYRFVGIGKTKTGVRVRYTNDLITQVKRFGREGLRAEFVELPNKIDKKSAAQYLRHRAIAQNPEAQAAIDHVISRFNAMEKKTRTIGRPRKAI